MSRRREHPPFPGKPQGIWRSSLRGMEQPVRSFKSFIRTVPPHPTSYSDKPLPPIPIPKDDPAGPSVSSPTTRLPNRTASVVWKAPADWDEQSTANQDSLLSPSFTTRNYAPLIPEPSPSNLEGEEPSSWPFDASSSRFSRLPSINEQDDLASLHSSTCPSEASQPFFQADSTRSLRVDTVQPVLQESKPHLVSPGPRNTGMMSPVSPLSDTLRASHVSTKQKAYASLGIEFHDDKQMIQELRSDQPKSPFSSDGFYSALSMHGKKLQPLNRKSIKDEESPIDAGISEKLQQLSISQDYHDILADHYQTEHARHSHEIIDGRIQASSFTRGITPRSNNGALVPRPLSWKKDSNAALSDKSHSNRQLGSRKRYRKMTNWVPFHPPINFHNRIHRNESVHAMRGTTLGLEANRSSKRDHHLPHLLPQVKGLKSHMKRALVSDGTRTNAASPAVTPQPSSTDSSLPLEPPPPLFRLPGGLALVRQSQTSTPSLSKTSHLGISPSLKLSHSNLQAEVPQFDIIANERRPSSLYSQQSEIPVAPGISIKRKLRIFAGSPPSPQSRSNTSTPPTSPLAHEISFPRTPPLPPPSRTALSHNMGDSIEDDRADSANEDEPQMRTLHVGILERARDARDAWKKHQRDAKHEKLKQSIRILGPTDIGSTVTYVRPQCRVLDYEGVDGIRVPGYMSGGML